MISVYKSAVMIKGAPDEITADLIAIFMSLIRKGCCPAITTALGVMLEEGGKALDDKND